MRRLELIGNVDPAGPSIAVSDGNLYFDVTDLVEYLTHNEAVSGIQRLTARLAQQFALRNGPSSLRLLLWRQDTRQAVWFPADIFASERCPDPLRLVAHFGIRQLSEGVADARPRHRLLGLHRPLRRRKTPRPTDDDPDTGRVVSIRAGDRLFLPGSSWRWPEHFDFVADARARGAHVIQLVCDLIPLLCPQYVADGTSRNFSAWIERVCQTVDEVITISQSAKRDLIEFFDESHFDRIPVHAVALAHEFVVDDSATALSAIRRGRFRIVRQGPTDDPNATEYLSAAVLNASHQPYILFAGTIEARKNVLRLARAYERLVERFGTGVPRLVLAGKKGWLVEDFDSFLAATGSLGGMICVVTSPSDAELAHLYRNCLFFVFPSFYEGWGLPIGEALWHGRPVAASNTSSMPEVGGDLVRYFDPTDIDQMISVIGSLIEDDKARANDAARIAEARSAGCFRTWSDVGDQMWRIISGSPADDTLPVASDRSSCVDAG